MHTLNEIAVQSWDELCTLVKESMSTRGQTLLFRGVSDRTHTLVPKIGRPGARKDPTRGSHLAHSEEAERRALRMFKRTARSLVAHEPKTDLEWLAVAQHFGAPTRLLDWSQSPFIAAYFALEKAGTTGVPGIYVVPMPHVVSESDAENPFGLKEVVAYLPPYISPRIQAQRSVFTVHPCPSTEYVPEGLTLWYFPSGSPWFELKQIVDRCGFNRASLYPDIGGLAEYVGWCYKWDTPLDP